MSPYPPCPCVGRLQLTRRHLFGWCMVILLSSCAPTGRRVAPQTTPPPKLSAEEMRHQGEAVSRRLAPDPLHFNIPSATLAVLTNEVATDMAWKEHFILQGEQADSYVVIMSEGTTLGAQRRINITPTARGSEVLVLPPDTGIAAGIKERTFAYLTGLSRGDADISPQVQRLPYALARVWTAVKETLIDAGFSFKTADADVGFIETEPVPVGKASRSWFGGSGQSLKPRPMLRLWGSWLEERLTFSQSPLVRGSAVPRWKASHPGSYCRRGASLRKTSWLG